MFRAQTNPFDEAVVKATDENLTSENWALILDVCDRVSGSPSGPQSAVAALIKRLAHRNANVQVYTLELANALSQNCGPPLHRELASRSFTDALLRLAEDRNTHHQVKTKVLERMQGWTDLFSKDPDLGIMAQACDKLQRGNPGLQPPSKPQKQTMGDEDRRKEEDDLQMALALSLRDKGAQPSTTPAAQDATPTTNASDVIGQPRAGTTAATVNRVRAIYDFQPTEPGELAFAKGDVIAVLESVYKDWWKGSLRGDTGIFPLNYVEKLQDPTPQELEHDAETEAEVFAQIRNVEKLLSLLSIRNEGRPGRPDSNEEEITELYHQTLAIRPKLIELIGKYSQKKDDFTTLNEKFIKARRDYEALLDASMSRPYGRPPQPGPAYPNAYGQPPQQSYPVTSTNLGQPGHPPRMHPPGPYGALISQNPPQQQPPAQASGQGYPLSQQYNPAGSDGAPPPFHFLPGGNVPQAHTQGMPPPAPSATPYQDDTHNRANSVPPGNPGYPQELASGSVHDTSGGSNDQAHIYQTNMQPYNPDQQPSQPPTSQQAYHPQPYRQSVSPTPSQPYPSNQLPIRQHTESSDQPGARQSYVAPQYQPPPSQPPPSQPPQSQQPYPPDQVHGHPPAYGPPPTRQADEDDASDYYR